MSSEMPLEMHNMANELLGTLSFFYCDKLKAC